MEFIATGRKVTLTPEQKREAAVVIDAWMKRIEDCKREGKHRDPQYILEGTNLQNMPVMKGICNYCHLGVERPLTGEEHRARERFRESIYRPFTI